MANSSPFQGLELYWSENSNRVNTVAIVIKCWQNQMQAQLLQTFTS